MFSNTLKFIQILFVFYSIKSAESDVKCCNNTPEECPQLTRCLGCFCRCFDGYIRVNTTNGCVDRNLFCESDISCGSSGSGVCKSNRCQCNQSFEWSAHHKQCLSKANKVKIKELIIEYLEIFIFVAIVSIIGLIICLQRNFDKIIAKFKKFRNETIVYKL